MFPSSLPRHFPRAWTHSHHDNQGTPWQATFTAFLRWHPAGASCLGAIVLDRSLHVFDVAALQMLAGTLHQRSGKRF